jgi:hypothetical protein
VTLQAVLPNSCSFGVFPIPSRKVSAYYHELGHNRFVSNPFQFIIS